MLDHVRLNAAEAGVRNIEPLECAAEDLGEPQTLFDAAICRLGLMLFPSPRKAAEAVRRALRPGGRFAALVFTTQANNPFMALPMTILLHHAGKSPPAPGQPGVFALGGKGILEDLMVGSGFEKVETKTVRAPLVLPSASDATQLMQEAAGAYRAVVADLSAADKPAAWREVHDCLTQFETDRGFEADLELMIGSGARPR
jgi:SAM-dependent methyltransferase